MTTPRHARDELATVTIDLADIGEGMVDSVGGKADGLAAMIRIGERVPAGFCLTTKAYRQGEIPEQAVLAAYRSHTHALDYFGTFYRDLLLNTLQLTPRHAAGTFLETHSNIDDWFPKPRPRKAGPPHGGLERRPEPQIRRLWLLGGLTVYI